MPEQDVIPWIRSWKPNRRWSETPRFSSEHAVILNAIVEHRAWVRNVICEYSNGENSEQIMDLHNCYLGRWFGNDGKAFMSRSQSAKAIHLKHREVHQIAAGLVILSQKGKTEKIEQELKSLSRASQELISLLEELTLI